ncbi:NAD(P)/FAD-dependent oxidoreductase [Nocardioides albus]|uniref:NADH dehydrogenase FAD-containing subunit n=1 Tax=Nocardioides albus TaxID=1841 RepID=A0A7W5A432_9ACTN|nr:FAD-dependent oxidoreductase [Nocardioides albus]MBB3089104.1 NADH dehydrogenase FAD-containing subunit [Nocardioides albus]GGU14212.1 NADH dehydrogenase [Nocardioides albus]
MNLDKQENRTSKPQVVVVGGGYAGVMAANRLTKREDIAITLVNPREHFVERIRLHELLVGSSEAVVAYADVLSPRVRLVVDTVTTIDAAGRTVALGSGQEVAYDYLVYAIGSAGTTRVTGAAEHAFGVSTYEEATRLKAALETTASDAPVVVVGGGPTGIEVSSELAEAGRNVALICGERLGPWLHEKGRAVAERDLRRLGVGIVEGARVAEVIDGGVRLDDGRELPSSVTIWTAGFTAPNLARASGLSTDELGRLVTDETLTSVDDDRIIATGDAAAPSGVAYRMSCQAANQLGPLAGETVLARLAGATPKPVGIGFVGQCISIGRGLGLVNLSRRDDTAVAGRVRGVPAAKIKELVCRSTVWALSMEARRPGSAFGFNDRSRSARVQAAARTALEEPSL